MAMTTPVCICIVVSAILLGHFVVTFEFQNTYISSITQIHSIYGESSLNDTSSTALHQSNQSSLAAFEPKNSSCIKPRPVSWEWNYFSKNATNMTENQPRKRLLIGLFSGFDKYARMLELTAPINKAYARKWGHDLVVLQGTAYILPIDKKCTPPGRRATLNKIHLLLNALEKRDAYDQLLLIDTDALVYDFDKDITALLPDKYMLAAQRVKENSTVVETYNINAGVMLWNLHHPFTLSFAREWDKLARKQIMQKTIRGDQQPLHQLLRKSPKIESNVYSLSDEFAYGHGTVIKHFIRHVEHRDWNDPNLVDHREDRIKRTAETICQRYQQVCTGIESIAYGDF
jgi:hypothetical protein